MATVIDDRTNAIGAMMWIEQKIVTVAQASHLGARYRFAAACA
jgi:hypothetical protein